MKAKYKGFNMMKPKPRTAHPNSKIGTWKLFVGDLVEVIDGRSSLGGRGKIKNIDKNKNLIWVEGVKLLSKKFTYKVNEDESSVQLKEMPIHYSNVQLVDPVTDKPTKVKLSWEYNNDKRRLEEVRIAKVSGARIAKPDRQKLAAQENDGLRNIDGFEWAPNVTSEMVSEKFCSWKPELRTPPFPNSFMNELERWRRKNKESQAL
ncbi:hypothetical protein HK096_006668 [Nowakowskiella sp. JEL0078]|nr:hypothetical protein HK096_006668 [Nowakowskiella sp. JEL0078]